MADMFDQVKFYAGLGVFLYAVYSIWGVKKAGLTPLGLGLPEMQLGDLIPGGEGGGAPEEPPADAESMMGYFYGMNIRDHGLPWQLTGWEKSDAVNRLTVA